MNNVMRVRDLMSHQVFTATPEDDLDFVRAIMGHRRVRHVPVVGADGALYGVVSHRDLVRHGPAGAGNGDRQPSLVSQVMSAPVQTIGPEAPLAEAAQVMLERKLGCLPVMAEGSLVGILTEADFVRHLGQR